MVIAIVGRESENLLLWWTRNQQAESGADYYCNSHIQYASEDNAYIRANLNYLSGTLNSASKYCSQLRLCLHRISKYANYLSTADCNTLRHHCMRLGEVRTVDGAVQQLVSEMYNAVTPLS